MALVKQGGVEFRVKYHAFFHAQIFLQSPSRDTLSSFCSVTRDNDSSFVLLCLANEVRQTVPGNLARLIRLVEPGNWM